MPIRNSNAKERVGLRKLLFEYIKYLPLIHSIMFTISIAGLCLGYYCTLIDFIFALSYNSILLYYLVGVYQNWCWKFRLCIYYLLTILTLWLLDHYVNVPLTNMQYFKVVITLFSTFCLYYICRSLYDKYNNDRIQC